MGDFLTVYFTLYLQNDQPGSNYEKVTLAQAKRIMKPFVLRRLKKDVSIVSYDTTIFLIVLSDELQS